MVAPFGLSIAQQIAARFAAQPEVTAVALGGSRSTGAADPRADIDLYVYAAPPIAVATRAAIASAMAAPGPREIDNHFWEPGDEWALASADDTLRIDIMYRAPAWIEAELDRVLVRHEASLGYSTCLWHNVRHASVLYDRDGWFAQLQGIAAAPYPEELRRATVATNRAVVRGIHSSLLHQLERAVERGDRVAVQHRLTAILASYFDILFATNRRTHPSEKRLVALALEQCDRLPANFPASLTILLDTPPGPATLDLVVTLLNDLDTLLLAEGLR
jgi:predicted nucleotidyltransferase